MKKTREQYLAEFLNWFWLRPESALLLALRAEKYFSTLGDFKSDSSIDVSCGDGVFSFITFGGEISPSSDMYQALDPKLATRKGDYDVFDHYSNSYHVEISKRPSVAYSVGADWKSNLLAKAGKLDFYQSLVEHDNNYPLPFEDRRFQYVYSNSAYWVQNFVNHLEDLVRITKPGGVIVLEIKNKNIEKFSSKNYLKGMLGDRACSILDAGRLSTWKGLKSESELMDLLSNLDGVSIERNEAIYGDAIGYIWDIGLRPLFNPLARLSSSVSSEVRIKAKEEWNKVLIDLFKDFIASYKAKDSECFERIYVLRKSV